VIKDFELPAEIAAQTYESILAKMLAAVPDKYDKTEAGFVYDMIAPSALEAAEMIQFWLPLALKTNFHMWASDEWLDLHASNCGLSRRPATPSYGDVQVVTTKAVKFPAGFIFSVPSEDGNPAIDFEVTQTVTINGAGTCRVKSVDTGSAQNIGADSIAIMKNPVGGVVSITNTALTGGSPAESDTSLRKRIDDFYAGQSSSFVGNCADYRRWALSVPGVGFCHVIPTYNGANSVKILLADFDGLPAADEVCAAVKKYIFGTSHDDIERLAPIGVTNYAVTSFRTHDISISMSATLSLPADVVKKNIRDNIAQFFKDHCDETLTYETLRYVDFAAVLSRTAGLEDFSNLRINGGVGNIIITEEELPSLTTITFT